MSEHDITWNEMCLRYRDEWVVIVDAEWVRPTTSDFEFRRGVVAGHGSTRRDAMKRAGSLVFGTTFTCFYNGEVPLLPLPCFERFLQAAELGTSLASGSGGVRTAKDS